MPLRLPGIRRTQRPRPQRERIVARDMRSTAPPHPAADVLPPDARALLHHLGDHGVEYLIVGEHAAAFHGYGPPFDELTVVPAPYARNFDRLASALKEVGAELRMKGEVQTLPVTLDGRTMRLYPQWTLSTELGNLDICMRPAGSGGYDELIDDARDEHLGGGCKVTVASLEEVLLIVQARDRGDQDEVVIERLSELLEEQEAERRAAREAL